MENRYCTLVISPQSDIDLYHEYDSQKIIDEYTFLLYRISTILSKNSTIRLVLAIPAVTLSYFALPSFQRICKAYMRSKENKEWELYLHGLQEEHYDMLAWIKYLKYLYQIEVIPAIQMPTFYTYIDDETFLRFSKPFLQCRMQLAIDTYQRTMGENLKGLMLSGVEYKPEFNSIIYQTGLQYIVIDQQVMDWTTSSSIRIDHHYTVWYKNLEKKRLDRLNDSPKTLSPLFIKHFPIETLSKSDIEVFIENHEVNQFQPVFLSEYIEKKYNSKLVDILSEKSSNDQIHRLKTNDREDVMMEFIHQQKPRLRVVFLCWEYPPLVVGGLSVAVNGLAVHMAKQGIEVHVVTSRVESTPKYELLDGVHIHRVGKYIDQVGGAFFDWTVHLNLEMVNEVDCLISGGLQFDLIHAHDWLVYFAAKYLKQVYDTPIIYSFHGLQAPRNKAAQVTEFDKIHEIEIKSSQMADRVITVSYSMKDDLQRLLGLSSEKINVISNGIQVPENPIAPTQLLEKAYVSVDEKMVLFIGRLVIEKGVHILLEAAKIVLQKYPKVKFVIAGDGYLRNVLEEKARELRVMEHVVFTGIVDRKKRDHLYQLADICVFPSLYEPFGIVALEAMSYQTPVIVSDTGGLSEIITHRKNGLRIKSGDIESLASQIIWCLENATSVNQMVEIAYEELSIKYNWNTIAKETISVYNEVCDSLTSFK
ncbi:glycosyltransferase family 4 protein [Hazenella sp. IB182353]|uniref:glycosyltransferase family 4 protein n=1 Tax=Polycladospora coralii TaxID=2771432 RepID=UPI001747794D|nr:glycosyltransferase family 4 protein [Polycladospora coralii]MBS7531144.1 glycosyltransferase family 4 protein [Polycladospora coralii]